MGTIKKGVLGGFSGKVGTAIGSSWNGIDYVRSLPQTVANPRTEKQVSNRVRFALVSSFLKPMTVFLRTGFKLYAHRRTAFNAAMSYTLSNAITGTYPDYALNYAAALVSRGNLTPAAGATAKAVGGNIELSWDDNSGIADAKQTDKALIVVLNPSKAQAITDTEGAERFTKGQTVVLPVDWAGDSVEVYLGFVSKDGKEVANSVYLGHKTVD
jgi:hypothetical protein